ncbi:MAG: hypothetical protein IPN74_16810 [Haliscomenobacter sp.]|nr:hypothetical protein [Haliscomenobacter sp.]
MRLGAREIELSIQSIDLREWTLQAGERLYPYRLVNWLALSPDNYRAYRDMPDESERLRFLASILRGNLLAMARASAEQRRGSQVVLHGVRGPRRPCKDARLSAFDAAFPATSPRPEASVWGKGSERTRVLYQAKRPKARGPSENPPRPGLLNVELLNVEP